MRYRQDEQLLLHLSFDFQYQLLQSGGLSCAFDLASICCNHDTNDKISCNKNIDCCQSSFLVLVICGCKCCWMCFGNTLSKVEVMMSSLRPAPDVFWYSSLIRSSDCICSNSVRLLSKFGKLIRVCKSEMLLDLVRGSNNWQS